MLNGVAAFFVAWGRQFRKIQTEQDPELPAGTVAVGSSSWSCG